MALPYQVDCVDIPIGAYFMTGKQPVRQSTCTGKPLLADQPLTLASAQLKRANASIGQPSSLFNDPVAAARLIEQIRNFNPRKP